jgi:hypothetical protein
MTDTKAAAVKLLLKRRKELRTAIAQTPEGQELAEVEGALLALGVDAEQPSGATRRRGRHTAEGSVRSKAQRLLDEEDRGWLYDDIIVEYERRGEPIQGADPRAALRTALWALQKEGHAVRLDDGAFFSTKFWPPKDAPAVAEEA